MDLPLPVVPITAKRREVNGGGLDGDTWLLDFQTAQPRQVDRTDKAKKSTETAA